MAIFEALPVTPSGRRVLSLAAQGPIMFELHVPTSDAWCLMKNHLAILDLLKFFGVDPTRLRWV
jgi:hypothetical protein